MNKFCLALAALAPLLLSATPAPEGGTPVTPTNAIAAMREVSASKYGTLTRVKAEGQPFSEALRCEVSTRPAHPWDIQFQFRTERKVEKGEVLWARFYARMLSAKTESGEGRICAIFEKNSPPNEKSLSFDLDLGREWKAFFFPFTSRATQAVTGGYNC
jgi:hypothetical protein